MNRPQPRGERFTETVLVRVRPSLKVKLDEMAAETGIPTSQVARLCLEERVAQWETAKAAAG